MLENPIALALVRRADARVLTLPGLQKLDLLGAHVPIGVRAEASLAKKLLNHGVSARSLVLRWQAVAGWAQGKARPVMVYEATAWTGEPTVECVWSTEEEVCRGARSELYRRFFAKLKDLGGDRGSEDASGVILEAPFAKPAPTRCPKCGDTMRLRNRKPGQAAVWDCSGCESSWGLAGASLARVPAIGA